MDAIILLTVTAVGSFDDDGSMVERRNDEMWCGHKKAMIVVFF